MHGHMNVNKKNVMSIFWNPIELLPINISGDLHAVHFSLNWFLLLHAGKVKLQKWAIPAIG
jgi:hypothetical protein